MSGGRSEREESDRVWASWTGEVFDQKTIDDMVDARDEADFDRWDDWERRRV